MVSGRNKKYNSIDERFMKSFEKLEDGKCWPWKYRPNGNGYGQIEISRGKSILAHRYSFERHSGIHPGDLLVCHSCDNRICVNPAHLFLGTVNDNNQDKILKNRAFYPKGEKSPNAKLKDEDVKIIKKMLSQGISGAEIARRFKTKRQNITAIKYNKTWSHIQ